MPIPRRGPSKNPRAKDLGSQPAGIARPGRRAYFLPQAPERLLKGLLTATPLCPIATELFLTALCPNFWASSLWGIRLGEQHPKARWPFVGAVVLSICLVLEPQRQGAATRCVQKSKVSLGTPGNSSHHVEGKGAECIQQSNWIALPGGHTLSWPWPWPWPRKRLSHPGSAD